MNTIMRLLPFGIATCVVATFFYLYVVATCVASPQSLNPTSCALSKFTTLFTITSTPTPGGDLNGEVVLSVNKQQHDNNDAETIIDIDDKQSGDDEQTIFYRNNNNIIKKKNLILMNALGRKSNLQYNVFAKQKHFPTEDGWDCVAFMYVNETVIPDNDPEYIQLQKEGCTIVRTPNVYWGNFLQYLAPPLVSHYNYIAILLDDVYLPDRGPNPINVPNLLNQMERHNITSISPGIMGDAHNVLRPRSFTRTIATYNSNNTNTNTTNNNKMEKTMAKYNSFNCLTEIKMLETFFQIFTLTGWNCFYQMLHHTGGRGFCFDLCYGTVCPDIKLAVDYAQIGYHLERTINQIPEGTHYGTNLTFNGLDSRIQNSGYYTSPNAKKLCNERHCPKKGKLRGKFSPIQCQNDTYLGV